MTTARPPTADRPPWRRIAARAVIVGVLTVQVAVILAGGGPHHVFAFRMFPEASTWQADVVRVTADGRRVPVEESWAGYRWSDLVTDGSLGTPRGERHADNGLDSVLDDLQRALDWVAASTPADTETVSYEATVRVSRNGHDEEVVVLRSRRPGGGPASSTEGTGPGAAP
ncbi:MAG: hypothetical protein IPM45_11515 [Acidimicrobiales bacterium]|nr:hypothetical protein [Acidimicrobiales bacterium]